jgi:hypothetical protein
MLRSFASAVSFGTPILTLLRPFLAARSIEIGQGDEMAE